MLSTCWVEAETSAVKRQSLTYEVCPRNSFRLLPVQRHGLSQAPQAHGVWACARTPFMGAERHSPLLRPWMRRVVSKEPESSCVPGAAALLSARSKCPCAGGGGGGGGGGGAATAAAAAAAAAAPNFRRAILRAILRAIACAAFLVKSSMLRCRGGAPMASFRRRRAISPASIAEHPAWFTSSVNISVDAGQTIDRQSVRGGDGPRERLEGSAYLHLGHS